jgi:hypothetical protein
MNRGIFALCLVLAAEPVAAQSNPENRAAAPPSAAPAHECEPYPACLMIESPLRPGASGVGIRDKELLEQMKGPLCDPQKQGAKPQ